MCGLEPSMCRDVGFVSTRYRWCDATLESVDVGSTSVFKKYVRLSLASAVASRRSQMQSPLHLPPATNECRCLCCVSIVKALFTSMVERHRFFKKSVYTLAVAGRFTCRSHEPRVSASECMYRLCKKKPFFKVFLAHPSSRRFDGVNA